MRITAKDVEHVADLARLALTEEEKVRLQNDLNTILKMAEKINELDTEGVEPMSHVLPLTNVFRKGVYPSLDKAEVLANAPDEEDGMFRVPRIMGTE